MKCPECGKEFVPLTVTQKFCTVKHGLVFRYRNRGKIAYPSVTFNCAQCGKVVVTDDGGKDMRTRFCCASCEKKFWRHPHWENPTNRINFHSVSEYASWERRTNA